MWDGFVDALVQKVSNNSLGEKVNDFKVGEGVEFVERGGLRVHDEILVFLF